MLGAQLSERHLKLLLQRSGQRFVHKRRFRETLTEQSRSRNTTRRKLRHLFVPSAPMRVLMISDVYFPRVNGVSTSIQTFRRDLAALGCETWLVAPEYPEGWQDDAACPAPAVALPRVRSRGPHDETARDARGVPRARRPRRRAAHSNAVRRALDRAQGCAPRCASRRSRPITRSSRSICITTCRCCRPRRTRARAHFLAAPMQRRRCASSRRRASSRTCCDGYGVTRPIHTIPTGSTSMSSRAATARAFRARYGIAADRPVMLLVGRVAHEKNIGFLLRVLGEVRGACRTCYSSSRAKAPRSRGCAARPQRRASRTTCCSSAISTGAVALLDCYRAADVFVFASRTETQGLVLLESLALGVPVVSTAVLGTKEVLRECGRSARRARGRCGVRGGRRTRSQRPRSYARRSRAPDASSSSGTGRAARWRDGYSRSTRNWSAPSARIR